MWRCVELHYTSKTIFNFNSSSAKMHFVLSAIESWLCATSLFLVASMLLCEGSLNISNEVSLGDILDDEPSIRSVSAEFGCRCRVHLKSFISFNAKSLRDLVWYGYSRCNNHRPCVCVCTHGTHDIWKVPHMIGDVLNLRVGWSESCREIGGYAYDFW